jgi:uncharacterized membrane protein
MLKQILILAFIFIIFDYIFLFTLSRDMWDAQITKIQGGAPPQYRVNAIALFTYVIMVTASYVFVVKHKYPPESAFGYGALLGLAMYGVFDGTNYVLFKDYSLYTYIYDVVYGILVTAIACTIASISH